MLTMLKKMFWSLGNWGGGGWCGGNEPSVWGGGRNIAPLSLLDNFLLTFAASSHQKKDIPLQEKATPSHWKKFFWLPHIPHTKIWNMIVFQSQEDHSSKFHPEWLMWQCGLGLSEKVKSGQGWWVFEIGNFSANWGLKDSSFGDIYILEEIEAIAVHLSQMQSAVGRKYAEVKNSASKENLSHENHKYLIQIDHRFWV